MCQIGQTVQLSFDYTFKKEEIKSNEKVLKNRLNLGDFFLYVKLNKVSVRTNRQTFKHKIEK